MTDNLDAYIERAIEWASRKLDSTDYRLLCLAFVEDAYEQANGIEMFGGSSAQESADLYGASLNRASPPKGSFVFYSSSGEVDGEMKYWGHVGLCIGNGEVIHAWDRVRINPYLEVEELTPAPGWTKPQYIGWSPVERILEGYRVKDWNVEG
ncbi:NlpC/P60 family protein [Cohnella boryungensis]|uniref:NlpC/P60 family protein n=1 Tax=Cohnella boryungensis TaxID=768479 RepID=A0ABV8SLR4_9BACL